MNTCREDLPSSQNLFIPSPLMEGKRRYLLTTSGLLVVGCTGDMQPKSGEH